MSTAIDKTTPWIKGETFAQNVGGYTTNVIPISQQNAARAIAFVYANFGDGHAIARLITAAPALLRLAKNIASECGECGGSGRRQERPFHESVACDACADIRDVIGLAEDTAP